MSDPRDRPLPLRAMLTAQTVRAKVAASTPDEASDRVGQLLVEAGSIEPRYVEAMQRVLREMGPYAVLAPGVVLLHARPEDGVRQPCLGLVTLAEAVAFGHSENDPVDVVFALGAVDKQAHVEALRQLAELLMDQEAMRQIRAAPDDRTLLDVIQSWNHPAQAR